LIFATLIIVETRNSDERRTGARPAPIILQFGAMRQRPYSGDSSTNGNIPHENQSFLFELPNIRSLNRAARATYHKRLLRPAKCHIDLVPADQAVQIKRSNVWNNYGIELQSLSLAYLSKVDINALGEITSS
jgi:hypothetical protein